MITNDGFTLEYNAAKKQIVKTKPTKSNKPKISIRKYIYIYILNHLINVVYNKYFIICAYLHS